MISAIPERSPTATHLSSFLGALPFVAFGMVSIAFHASGAVSQPPIWLHPFLLMNGFVLLGLGAGILAGFRRWTYTYLFWALILTWWLSDMRIYGLYEFDSRMWLLPLGVFLLALFMRRSLAPLRTMFASLRHDWTLLALGIYSLYAWVMILSDESHHPYQQVLILLSTLAAAGGAWLYFRQGSAILRVLSLVAGLSGAIVIGMFTSTSWDWRAYYNLPAGGSNINPIALAILALVLGLMLMIGVLARCRES